jgi:hypothetical protein
MRLITRASSVALGTLSLGVLAYASDMPGSGAHLSRPLQMDRGGDGSPRERKNAMIVEGPSGLGELCLEDGNVVFNSQEVWLVAAE